MKIKEKYILKNMLSRSCISLIKLHFKDIQDVTLISVQLGEVELKYEKDKISVNEIYKHFENIGFAVVHDPDVEIVEKTKVAAVELIHYANNTNSLIRNSDYISERLQIPYDRISKIFSGVTGTTLEKYIILLKIEKAKALISNKQFTLSEISYMLGYSSVQYLSIQFKKITGQTVSDYKNNPKTIRNPLEELIP